MTASPGLEILLDVLTEYHARLSIDYSSHILVTSPALAKTLAERYSDISTPYGPKFTVATVGPDTASSASAGETEVLGQNVTTEPMEGLMGKMDFFTHAITDVSLASGGTVMEVMKWANYALRPKGIAVVIAMEAVPEMKGGRFGERMKAESKGRVAGLVEIFEYAGFETGKVRRVERDGAQVVIGMKWDQLTA
ncbi:hypothetical protein LTR62_002633 [Meristemomyces frigidus]|uniref:Uncharacterized protein n=1 Tax=Meristemomyces frigidus TaxID=1508187 RepID=A0AAN7T8C7_9PEZI|nr:hypothetical protein LTR62_002633 [Meristemomyces frigidus]